jgi:hypothetical protein
MNSSGILNREEAGIQLAKLALPFGDLKLVPVEKPAESRAEIA